MVRKLATVVGWHNGYVILRYASDFGCAGCIARSTCGSFILNKRGFKIEYQLELEINHPLVVGQKIEIGIPEKSLLRLAMLVYLTPLLLLFIIASITQFFFLNQLIIFFSAVIGIGISFFLIKKVWYYWEKEILYRPTIFQIGLPPSELKE